MVLKIVKHGVRSGNTLRGSNSRFNRQYKRQSCLVRHVQNITKVTTILDDLSITDNDVAYSLNKKARWNLPQVLKHYIQTKRHVAGDVKIDLVESHKLKRQSNCIGFYSTTGPFKKILPKYRTYFNARSLNTRRNTRKRKRNRTTEEDITTTDEKQNDKPELTVNLLYPCPSSCSITHNPKYMQTNVYVMDDNQQLEDETRPQNSKPVKSNRKKRRSRVNINGKGTRNLLEEYGYNDYDSELEELDDDEDGEVRDYSFQRNFTVTVDDILDHAKNLQQLCTDKENKRTFCDRTSVQNSEKQAKKVYINREEKDATKSTSVHENKIFPAVMKPVNVLLPVEDVRPEVLHKTFGSAYRECNCLPRKFILDISKKAFTILSRSKAFRSEKIYEKDLSVVLVFAYDILNSLDTTCVDSYKVYLNMKTACETLKIETLLENEVLSIDEVIHRSIGYIETIPIDYMTRKSYPLTSPKHTEFELLCDSYNTKTENYRMKETFLRDMFNTSNDITSKEEKVSYSFPPDFCNICFEVIDDKSCTALETCGHWFCDDCWRDHVISKLNSGTHRVTCPEFDCNSTMEKAVIVTIAHLPLVEKLFYREQETLISSDESKKWCPNKNCGRILTSTTLGNCVNVACDCGVEICFDCLGPAHWPVPCDKTLSYWTKISQNNDVNRLLFINRLETVSKVRGKCCPSCKRFIEKEGGCFSMRCVCGTHFCWGCGQPHGATHIYTEKCSQNIVGDKVGTSEKKIPIIPETPQNRSKLYQAAVKSRSLRHPTEMRHMKTGMYHICTKLKILNRKYGDKFGRELESFEVVGSRCNIADKIKPFMESMVKIYCELLNVEEYIAVYVDNDKHSPHKMLISHMEKLQELASNISFTISQGTKQDIGSIIPNLMELRFQSKKCISSLAKKLNILK